MVTDTKIVKVKNTPIALVGLQSNVALSIYFQAIPFVKGEGQAAYFDLCSGISSSSGPIDPPWLSKLPKIGMNSFVLLLLGSFFAPTFETNCEELAKTVTLHANGELKRGIEGRGSSSAVTLKGSDFSLGRSVEEGIGKFRNASLHGSPQVYNQLGVRLRSYEEIQPGDQLFLFVWPADNNHVLDSSRFPPEAAMSASAMLEPVFQSPRIFRIASFLSAEEADQLVQQAESSGNLTRSVLGINAGKSRSRTSASYFDRDTPLARRLVARGLRVLGLDGSIPDEQHEGLQLVRYQPGQAFVSHTDFFPPADYPHVNVEPAEGGSNRFATFFIYLNDVPDTAGGKTAFFKLPPLPGQYANSEEELDSANLSDEARALARECNQHAGFTPQRGDAILFYSQTGNGKLDHGSRHAGCPLLIGLKYAANLWVWNAPQPQRLTEPKPKPFLIRNDLKKWTGPRREMTWDEEPEDLRPPVVVTKNGNVEARIDTKRMQAVRGFSGDEWIAYREGEPDRPLRRWTQQPTDAGSTIILTDPE